MSTMKSREKQSYKRAKPEGMECSTKDREMKGEGDLRLRECYLMASSLNIGLWLAPVI